MVQLFELFEPKDIGFVQQFELFNTSSVQETFPLPQPACPIMLTVFEKVFDHRRTLGGRVVRMLQTCIYISNYLFKHK